MTLIQTHPKPRRYVDKAYLAYIRLKRCVVCNAPAPSVPHHVVSKGAGGGDLMTIPVCYVCHTKIHAGYFKKEDFLFECKMLEEKYMEAKDETNDG